VNFRPLPSLAQIEKENQHCRIEVASPDARAYRAPPRRSDGSKTFSTT
jgi:hypothetical protein